MGRVFVRSLSRTAKEWNAPKRGCLSFFCSCVMTAPLFCSAPVPDAVTTAPIGMNLDGKRWWTYHASHTSSYIKACAETILQQSMTAPTASINSMPFSRAIRAPSCTFAYVGLDMIPPKSVTCSPHSSSHERSLAYSPVLLRDALRRQGVHESRHAPFPLLSLFGTTFAKMLTDRILVVETVHDVMLNARENHFNKSEQFRQVIAYTDYGLICPFCG